MRSDGTKHGTLSWLPAAFSAIGIAGMPIGARGEEAAFQRVRSRTKSRPIAASGQLRPQCLVLLLQIGDPLRHLT